MRPNINKIQENPTPRNATKLFVLPPPWDCMGSSTTATVARSPPHLLPPPLNPIIIIIHLLFILLPSALSGPVSSSISLNFTATYYQYIDSSGAFLASRNGSFQAKIINPKPENRSFYLVVAHVPSGTIIWSANRNTPISESSEFRFSLDGMTLFDDRKKPIWSTPRNRVPVSSLQLLESGNLVMLDGANNTVWGSFDYPTDVIVAGQELKVGKSLVASSKDGDLAESSYALVVGNNDAMLQWNGMTYWELSMATNAQRDTNWPVEFMMMNYTGVYLIGKNGAQVVIRIPLHSSADEADDPSAFHIMTLDFHGVFSVLKVSSSGSSRIEFKAPDDSCRIPFTCGMLGYCTFGGTCQCAPGFHSDPRTAAQICVPIDGSLALPVPCNGSQSNISNIKYLPLGVDVDYFSNDFSNPVLHNVDLTACMNLCSGNCSCLGFFYSKGSGSCFVIENQIGSMRTKSSSPTDNDRFGYIKTVVVGASVGVRASKESDFPVLAAILLPSSGVMAIAMVAFLIWFRRRRIKRRWSRRINLKLDHGNSMFAEEEMDFTSIPGLPVRFGYEELVIATESFKTQIGSGGFGTVYKGTLEDGADVAVKKITCLGAQGRREFLTEIAIIGKIHHINLVRLKGFCAQGGQKFLVYEYMNRGSLNITLFHSEPVMEWNQRYEIALGTARGLAYLHTGCENKIIHCDVKPENILLHDKSQVKISDFGLSKLLTPEESNLFTTLRGTRGYLAPEWLTSSGISEKTDVYSYGMVLLEIIRGKKNSSQTRSANSGTDSNRGNKQSSPSSAESEHRPIYFPLFALDMHEEGRYVELADPRLMGRVASGEVEKLVRIALCCVQEEPNLRPSMTNVVGMLEGVIPLGEPRMESLNFLRFYGRRFTEESRLGENDEQNELRLYRQPTGTNTSSSYNSLSYMSSQEVSGPR